MADSYNVKKITELAAKSASDDTDLYVVGNQGTATMRKISFATIAAAVRDKLTSLTFPSLNTSNKTLPGAINELNSNIGKLDASSAYAGNQNPDNYTVTGAYHIGLASGSSPTGTAIYGILIVWAHSGTIAQIFIRNTGRTYIRAKADTGSAWIAWNLVRWE